MVAFANPEILVKTIEHMPHKTAKEIVAAAKVTYCKWTCDKL